MATQEERFEEMRRKTSRKIKSAATKLFTQKTFAKTTMADIAKEADVSTGLAYRYYKSKQELFDEIVREGIEGLGEVEEAFKNSHDPKETFYIVTEEMLKALKEDPDTANMLFLFVQSILPKENNPLVEELLEVDNRLIENIARVIKEGQTKGYFYEGDPKTLAVYFLSSYQGLGMMSVVFENNIQIPDTKTVLRFLIK